MLSLFNAIRRYRFRKAILLACAALIELNKQLFASYLNQDGLLKQAKQLHRQHKKYYRLIQWCHRLAAEDSDGKQKLGQIVSVHQIICAIHLLKFRINDLSLFEICSEEMQLLQKSSTKFLTACFKQVELVEIENQFLESIEAFENIYTNTLKVVSRDPVVFQFFIQDLYALQQWRVKS